MKSFDTDIKKYSEKINLTASERKALRERVVSYMEYHPLRASTARTARRAGIPSQQFVTLRVNSLFGRITGVLAVVVFAFVSVAAQTAVPGDMLYLVKTGVNENLEGQFANTPYEKIEFETKLMERRITEARALAEEGKLTDDLEAQIIEDVKEHTQAVQEGLATLRTQDAEGAAIAKIAFNSSLEVQSAVLGAEVGGGDDTMTMSMKADIETIEPSPIESILTAVNEAREVVVSAEDATPSFEALAAQVKEETTRAYELFTTIQNSAERDNLRNIERRLTDIDRLIEKAQERHEKNPELGSKDLEATLSRVQKLNKYMSNIDVRENVPLDSLIPVVLSDEERAALVREEVNVIEQLKNDIEARAVNTDEEISEKVADGIQAIEASLLKTTTALEVNDIETAEEAIAEARAYVSDLDALTFSFIEEVPAEEIPAEQNDPLLTPTTTPEESGTETVL